MSIQPTPHPQLPEASGPLGGAHLRRLEKATRHNQRIALVWSAVAAVGFVLSSVVPTDVQAPFEFMRWVGLIVALLYAGRWMQTQRMKSWWRTETEGQEGPDWDTIAPSARLAVRSYASVQEAAERGWFFGEKHGFYENSPIPEWAELDGQRFVYDGLALGPATGMVPDNTRLFGPLRYVRPPAQLPALPA